MIDIHHVEQYGVLVRIQPDAGGWLERMCWFSELGRTGAELAAVRWVQAMDQIRIKLNALN